MIEEIFWISIIGIWGIVLFIALYSLWKARKVIEEYAQRIYEEKKVEK